jgi:Protein of unknown function (DUF1553)/Protein of unknown function (DUF1549)
MKSSKALTIGLSCLSLGLGLARAEENASRMWTDSKGRQIKATFVGLDGDKISIQTELGQVYTFALSNLTPEDQAIAKTLKPAAAYITNNATVAAAAGFIDKLATKGLVTGAALITKNNATTTNKADIRPVPAANKLMTDEQFVRRIFLDIGGRIPTLDETKEFLASTSKTKRAELIDRLLDSPGYNSHTYNYFAEMLRIKHDFDQNNLRGDPYVAWLQDKIAKNRPWTEIVNEMITADGKLWHNGAAGYLLRDAGMPLDNLANTLAVFLGTDVACAQCHDHPFADWSQRQFYEMAAYFGSTTTNLRTAARRRGKDGDMAMRERTEKMMSEIEELITAAGMDIRRERNGVQNFIGANRNIISDMEENGMKLPHDYKYKDGKPNEPVAPKLIAWSKSDLSSPAYKVAKTKNNEKLRGAFAAWMTHPENPRFAMSIANRMWKRAFGQAVAEPVTNIDDPEKASNPELLKHLAAEMKRLKFDLKAFMRILYNTQTYQREATNEEIHMGEPYYFQGPQLRRMTAEQAWDSYMALQIGNPDGYAQPLEDLYSRAINLDLTNEKLDAKTVLMKYAAFRKMNETIREFEGTAAKEAGMEDMMMMGRGNRNNALRRAAEITQPAGGGHFLTEFGQSQRLLIDGGNKIGSVPQVLMLMNGNAQSQLTSSSSLLVKNLANVSTPAEKIESIFLSILHRKPNENEVAMANKTLANASSDSEYADLIWALINTREFMFVQ